VVELKDHDVRLAAVHAWVVAEILDDLLPYLRAPHRNLAEKPCLFAVMVLLIVPRVRLGETVAAPRLQLRLTPPHRGKRI